MSTTRTTDDAKPEKTTLEKLMSLSEAAREYIYSLILDAEARTSGELPPSS